MSVYREIKVNSKVKMNIRTIYMKGMYNIFLYQLNVTIKILFFMIYYIHAILFFKYSLQSIIPSIY